MSDNTLVVAGIVTALVQVTKMQFPRLGNLTIVATCWGYGVLVTALMYPFSFIQVVTDGFIAGLVASGIWGQAKSIVVEKSKPGKVRSK